MKTTIPDALHICPACSDELVSGPGDLCWICRNVRPGVTYPLAEIALPPPPPPSVHAPSDLVLAARISARLLLIVAGVSLSFFLLPYAIRAVFWAERILGK